jgi:NAD(P)H-hydrate repair Nnr-like enzyme with NAD(P)H-hydrate dehydratase domain
VVGVNTRVDVRLDPHFAASIRDRGVREPIIVRRRVEDGALVVRKGQRRTLAAVRAGLDRVKVLVEVEAEPDSSASAQIERIVDQLGENQHREHRRRRRGPRPPAGDRVPAMGCGAQTWAPSAVVVVAPGELREDTGLVADGPGIVTGGQQHHLVRAELVLATVVHHDVQASAEHERDVR